MAARRPYVIAREMTKKDNKKDNKQLSFKNGAMSSWLQKQPVAAAAQAPPPQLIDLAAPLQVVAADIPALKSSMRTPKTNVKKRARKLNTGWSPSYSSSIHKVLKHNNLEQISCKGMAVMEALIIDTFERISEEAGKLVRYGKRSTMTVRDIETALRLVLPGELAKHAINSGKAALRTYNRPSRCPHGPDCINGERCPLLYPQYQMHQQDKARRLTRSNTMRSDPSYAASSQDSQA